MLCYVMIVFVGFKEINLGHWNVCHVHTHDYKLKPVCDVMDQSLLSFTDRFMYRTRSKTFSIFSLHLCSFEIGFLL